MSDIFKRNNVKVIGNGDQVMLFAHGFGCDQNAWDYIKGAFINDYKLILFDYVGAGNSDISAYDPHKYNTLNGYAQDILDICHELKLTNAVFIGHSVSSMIGALAAIKEPGIFAKLIFIGPSPCYISKGEYAGGFDQATIDSLLEVMEEDYITWAKSMAPSIMDKGNGETLSNRLSDSFCAIDPDIAKDFARVTFLSDNRKDLASIPVRSLTIQCAEDIIAPLHVGEYIHKNTPGNTLTILDVRGHCPHMSHPEQTIAAIRAYLE